MRTCKLRPNKAAFYKNTIPELIEIYDDFESGNTSMLNMKKSLEYQVSKGINAVQMEDDIILCKDFKRKIINEITSKPSDIINFFSMRKDDFTIGSRYISGYKYLMNQCFYLPINIAKLVLDTYSEFEKYRTDNNIGGTDSLIAYCLKKYKLKYWNVVPNLVDHIEGISAIDKRRSSKRQSYTFKYE